MADHSKPTTASTYTNFVSELSSRFNDLAMGMDPVYATAITNPPTNTYRFSSAAGKWQRYDGASWVDAATTYAISISGNAATVTNGVVTSGSYANPTWLTSLAGTKVTGDIAGNAGSATVLQTARTINGVSFNGSANISVNTVNATTFNNGGAGAASGTTFNGGSAVTVSYNTVGAPSTTGANASGTWGINISGNAATASACSGNSATATNATNASVATSAVTLQTNAWYVHEVSGYLFFDYNGTPMMRLDPATGNLVVKGNVTAYGTP